LQIIYSYKDLATISSGTIIPLDFDGFSQNKIAMNKTLADICLNGLINDVGGLLSQSGDHNYH